MKTKTMTDDQVSYAISHGEFGSNVICACRRVAVALTQDWCPQWSSISAWLNLIEEPTDLAVFVFVYNVSPRFPEFLDLKENRWGNARIPYVRYYVDGKLVNESNYVTKEAFLASFEGNPRLD